MLPSHPSKQRSNARTNGMYVCAVVSLSVCLLLTFAYWRWEVNSLIIVNDQLSKELDKVRQDVYKKDEELAAQANTVKMFTEERDNLKGSNSDLKSEVEKLKEEKQKLESERDESRAKIEAITNEKNELAEKYVFALNSSSNCVRIFRVSKLESQKDAKENEEINNLKKELETAKEKSDSLERAKTEEINKLKSSLDETNATIKQLKESAEVGTRTDDTKTEVTTTTTTNQVESGSDTNQVKASDTIETTKEKTTSSIETTGGGGNSETTSTETIEKSKPDETSKESTETQQTN